MVALNSPRVSIVIPVFNLELYIERCILSCVNQSIVDIEIIVINDGSSDKSLEKITELASEDARIVLINQTNQGVVQARKQGLERSIGEYVFFLDGDDFIPEGALQQLLTKADETRAEIVLGDYAFIDESGIVKPKFISTFNEIAGEEFIAFMIKNQQLYLCFKLIKLSLIKNVNIPKNITLGEDGIAIVQIVKQAQKVAKLDECVYYYFRRSNSVTIDPSPQDFMNANFAAQWIFDFVDLNFEFRNKLEILRAYKARALLLYIKRLHITGAYNNSVAADLSYCNILKVFSPDKLQVTRLELLALKIAYFDIEFASTFLIKLQRTREVLSMLKKKLI